MSGDDIELAEPESPSFVYVHSAHYSSMTDTRFSAAAAGPMVTVEVGLDRERFLIHKALLVYHSEYFVAATRGPWKDT